VDKVTNDDYQNLIIQNKERFCDILKTICIEHMCSVVSDGAFSLHHRRESSDDGLILQSIMTKEKQISLLCSFVQGTVGFNGLDFSLRNMLLDFRIKTHTARILREAE